MGNGQEMSPLYKKKDVQLLIGGNLNSPGLSKGPIIGNNNWSAAPSAGPSPPQDYIEAQSFSSLAKQWKQNANNEDNSLCISQGEQSPPLYGQSKVPGASRGGARGVGSEHSAFRKQSSPKPGSNQQQHITYIPDSQPTPPNLISQT